MSDSLTAATNAAAAAGDQDETAEPIQRWRPAGINITA